MEKRWGWLADLISRVANGGTWRKPSKLEKALIRKITREAQERKRAASDDDTKPDHKRKGPP